ncbi:hypothetical protein FNV43_RR02649 [Rhamnella rubrinervis]|uniref:3'-5' exonuclease domain-containing protein n=1 Tax=Rhamnella rubrinervis TaxID=2594499 RepID=A0A8K0MTD7_9ROSA|nr:hypothetical protein FNV43_RR02649 [Rhamnella rubrinervis]
MFETSQAMDDEVALRPHLVHQDMIFASYLPILKLLKVKIGCYELKRKLEPEDSVYWLSSAYRLENESASNSIVGLDIEWRPYYRPSDRNPVAIMQICMDHHCLIFQLLHADAIPESLVYFLNDPEFTFVGVGVKDDADKLLDHYQLRVGRTLDLAQTAAEKFQVPDFGRRGLKRLAMELIGKVMEKPKHVTLSDWDIKKLSYEQIEYASIDAYVSFELGMFLMDYSRARSSSILVHGCSLYFHQPEQHQRQHYSAANYHYLLFCGQPPLSS